MPLPFNSIKETPVIWNPNQTELTRYTGPDFAFHTDDCEELVYVKDGTVRVDLALANRILADQEGDIRDCGKALSAMIIEIFEMGKKAALAEIAKPAEEKDARCGLTVERNPFSRKLGL